MALVELKTKTIFQTLYDIKLYRSLLMLYTKGLTLVIYGPTANEIVDDECEENPYSLLFTCYILMWF